MKAEVSVIIPVYNRSESLGRAVDSVLEQSGVSFELIVVDDGSEEPARDVFERVENAGHRVLTLQENVGPGPARNRGVEVSQGEWLAFLDSDDHWLPGKLAKHLAHLKQSGLSIGQTDEIWYRSGLRVSPPKPHRITGGDLFLRSLKAVCVSSSTVVLRRELFEKSGGFDGAMFVCEDYDLWLRVSALELFEHLQEPLVVKYGGDPDQLSQALPAMDRYRIYSVLKGLHRGWFSSADQRTTALVELGRKLKILRKGSAKRDLAEAVEKCLEIERLADVEDWSRALDVSCELISLWPVKPNRSEGGERI